MPPSPRGPAGRLLRRFRPPALGLRWRMALWVGTVLLVSFGVVFVVVYRDTGSQVRSQINRDVASEVRELATALRSAGAHSPARIEASAAHYLRALPFRSSAPLLFVLVPGARPASNHPEVFDAEAPERGESPAEQAQENRADSALGRPRLGYYTTSVADAGRMTLLERRISVRGVRVVVAAGEPLATVDVAQHGVARAFLLAGVLVLVLALIASYLAATGVSAPLRRMAAVAARVDAGDLAPRMEVSRGRRDEVRVMAEAFNHMLDRLAEAFAGQRAFVADASHELRTPLTVIRGQLEVLAAQESPPGEEVRRVERLVQAEIGRLSRMVDDLLVLARAERTDFVRPEPVDLKPFVDELWDGLSLTARRRFELGDVPEGTLDSDPDRVAQAVRNLARNAVEHTAENTGRVRLEVDELKPGTLRFSVIDDGPGIPPGDRMRVFERFHRVEADRNRASGGAGLGLSIVRAVAEAHGGRVYVAESNGQPGARVELVLPGFNRR